MAETDVARPRLVTPRRVVMSLMLAVAASGMVYAFNSAPTEEPVTCSSADVEFVSPCGGDLELRQTEILVDLRAGLTGVLQIDGIEIPEDQLARIEPLNQFRYTPGPGKETGALEPGRHTAEAVYWPIGGSRADSESYIWTFNLH